MGMQMKITKIISFLIIVIISSQSLFCTTENSQESTETFLRSFIEKQKNKYLIKYDENKDEIIILVDRSKITKWSGPSAIVSGILCLAGLCALFVPMKNNIRIPLIVMVTAGLLFAVYGGLKAFSSPQEPQQYLKLTPEGLERYNDFVMAWEDVDQSLKTTVLDELYTALNLLHVKTLPDPARTKIVIRYKTKNNSRLLDLDESGDQPCPISTEDLLELINYYYEKYGRPKAELPNTTV